MTGVPSPSAPDVRWNVPFDRRQALWMLGLGFIAAACSSGTTKGSGSGATKLAPVPPSQRIPAEALQSATSFAGTYRGTWSGGNGTGNATVNVRIDTPHRTAQGDITLDAGFFGSGSSGASEHLDFNLNDYAYEMPPYRGTSKIFGPVTMTGPGRGFVRLDSQAVPHHPDIKSFSIEGVLTGPGASSNGDLPFRYEMHQSNGNVIAGVITFHPPG